MLSVLVRGIVHTLGVSGATTGANAVIQKSNNEVTHLVRAVKRLLRRKPARAEGRPLKAKRQAS